jgi:hypothetical protein
MRLLASLAAVLGVGCGSATPAAAPAPPTSAASSTAPKLEPGKGLVISPKCSDVHEAVRVEIEDSGSAGTLMVHVTNTSADLLSISGASKRASAGYGGLDQGEHVSFQMKTGDNYYVVAARTKDVFAGGDFKAGAPTTCGDELRALEIDARARVGLAPR